MLDWTFEEVNSGSWNLKCAFFIKINAAVGETLIYPFFPSLTFIHLSCTLSSQMSDSPDSQCAASISPCFSPLLSSTNPLPQLPSHFHPESFRFHWYSLSVPPTYQSVLHSHSLHQWPYRSQWLSDQLPTASQFFVAPVLRCMGNFHRIWGNTIAVCQRYTCSYHHCSLVATSALRDLWENGVRWNIQRRGL